MGIGTLAKSGERRAVIIGGSMSGLFAATLLARAGWQADIYERAEAELSGRGAGIVTHPAMRDVLRAAGCDPSRDLGIEVAGRKTLDREGGVIGRHACPQTLTSWDRVFRMLRDNFPPQRYHLGKELRHLAPTAAGVVAQFAEGTAVEAELLVGADGFRSSVRAQILPDVRPVYAGYVAWRGLVAESALSRAAHEALFDALVFCLPPGEQCLSYPVAGPDNDLRPGHRRCNFVWYRPAAESAELRRLLTDATGRLHALGIPPPLVRPEVIAELREAARSLLPPQLDEVVRLTARPFLQPIYEVETPHTVRGRVALLGDAAFLARPHVAAGVTKAAQDAMALADALQSNDIDSGLAQFDAARSGVNRQVMQRGRDLGSYLQPHPGSPEQRRKAALHGTPQAVMSEVAVLDFLQA
jgi:2-polyprenyl-6-methoxyphenol hydroxylase-like FAD-dependent oxidoreductase